MKKHIPNLFTLLNLLCGCLGIIACFNHYYEFIPVFVGVALVADFLDGLIARALNVKSDLGAQLDSLADMVTFGVLPGFMLYNIMVNTAIYDIQVIGRTFKFSGLIYILFACLRLAKFNIDTRQSENFIGLATPAGAIFVLGLFCKFHLDGFNLPVLYDSFYLSMISLLLSYLMIVEVSFFSLKGNLLNWKQNKFRAIFLLSCIPQIFIFGWLSLSTIITTYIFFAFLENIIGKLKADS